MEYVRRKRQHADMFFCLIQWICRLNRIVVVTVRSQLDGDLHICIGKEEESVSPAGKWSFYGTLCVLFRLQLIVTHILRTLFMWPIVNHSSSYKRRHRALPQLSLWTGWRRTRIETINTNWFWFMTLFLLLIEKRLITSCKSQWPLCDSMQHSNQRVDLKLRALANYKPLNWMLLVLHTVVDTNSTTAFTYLHVVRIERSRDR